MSENKNCRYGLNVAWGTFMGCGICSGIAAVIVLFVIYILLPNILGTDHGCSLHSYQGSCYTYKSYVGPSGSCDHGVKSSDGYCYSDYCYKYTHHDGCYKYRTYVGNSSNCTYGETSVTGYCYSNDCFYYEYADICYGYKTNMSSGICSGVRPRSPDNFCYIPCPADMYTYRGSCYGDKKYVGNSSTCTGVRSGNYCYYTFCPFFEHFHICYRYYKYVANNSQRYDMPCVRSSDGRCYYTYCPDYLYRGSCYENRKDISSTRGCNGLRSSEGCCYSGRYY